MLLEISVFRRSGVCFTPALVCFKELQLPCQEIHADFFAKASKKVRPQKKVTKSFVTILSYYGDILYSI